MEGWNSSLGGGFGLSDYLSMSIIPTNDWQNGDYHHLVTNSFQMGGDLGGSFGIDKTYVLYAR